jgi:hypothetical protein
MNAVPRLLPVDLTGYGLDVLAGTAVAEFNCQNLTSEDDGYAMERIAMPTCRLARREKQPSYECGSTLVKGLLDHSVLHLPSGDFPTSAVNVQSQINKNRTTSIAVWKSHPPLYSCEYKLIVALPKAPVSRYPRPFFPVLIRLIHFFGEKSKRESKGGSEYVREYVWEDTA